ncbi:unnamed protein product [Urochloa humidicola]
MPPADPTRLVGCCARACAEEKQRGERGKGGSGVEGEERPAVPPESSRSPKIPPWRFTPEQLPHRSSPSSSMLLPRRLRHRGWRAALPRRRRRGSLLLLHASRSVPNATAVANWASSISPRFQASRAPPRPYLVSPLKSAAPPILLRHGPVLRRRRPVPPWPVLQRRGLLLRPGR